MNSEGKRAGSKGKRILGTKNRKCKASKVERARYRLRESQSIWRQRQNPEHQGPAGLGTMGRHSGGDLTEYAF